MVTTLTLSGATLLKAGAGVSSNFTGFNGLANLDPLINQIEGTVGAATTRDWVNDYSGLSTNIKKILDEVTSNLAAIYAISYDMSGYNSVTEAQTMADILLNGALRGISILKDKNTQDFMDGVV